MVGAAVVSAGAAIYSAYESGEQADQAQSSQEQAMAQQQAIADEQMAYQQELRSQWDQTFGSVERNLSDYYNNLSPEKLTTAGVQANQESFQAVQKQLQQTLAQRGISGTGVEAQGLTQLAVSQAQQDANVRVNAPQQVAQQQQGFYSLGIPQKQAIQGGINSAYGSQMGVQQGAYNHYSNQYNQAQQAQNAAYGSLANVVGQTAAYYGAETQPQTQPYNPYAQPTTGGTK